MPGKKRPVIRISSNQRAVRVPRTKIEQLIRFAADKEGAGLAEIDVAVVDSSTISTLNRQYLRHRGETDVLSFDLSDHASGGIVAQIVVSGDVAARQAPLHGLGVQQELLLYVLHGLLHLLGYEDHSIRGAVRMHAREDELLAEFRKWLTDKK